MRRCCSKWLVKVTLDTLKSSGSASACHSFTGKSTTCHFSETTNTARDKICLTNNHYTSNLNTKPTRSQWYHCHPLKNSRHSQTNHIMIQLGILKFQTLLLVVLLFICTCTYLHGVFPAFLDRNKNGYVEKAVMRRILRRRETESDIPRRPLGTFWRAARVGERLSPYVSLCCVAMAVGLLR